MRRLALLVALLAMLVLSPSAAAAGPLVAGGAVESAGTGGATITGDTASAPAAAVGGDAFAQSAVEPETPVTTDITVQLRADRDARWRIEMRYPLTSANETAAFRRYGEAFERGDADGALQAQTFEYLADASSSIANRQMAIQNVSRSATVEEDVGVLRLSFTWTAFLSSSGDHLILRDAFRLSDDRTWLGTLDPNQQLVIETPPGYVINSTNAPVVQQSESVVIEGPRTFDTDDPLTIRYEPQTGIAGYPWELVAGVGVALIIVLIALVWRRGRNTGSVSDNDSGPESPHDPVQTATQDGSDVDTSGTASDTHSDGQGATGSGSGARGVGAGAGMGAGAGSRVGESEDSPDANAEIEGTEQLTEDPDPSLLSDEERVEKLLERRGGRMRQAEIVETTGWSDAKVSQLLSSMVEDDRIEKLRLGRENLISLPDEESD
jgi:uncharacterized membrane protein